MVCFVSGISMECPATAKTHVALARGNVVCFVSGISMDCPATAKMHEALARVECGVLWFWHQYKVSSQS